jgi:hypothetical protein
MKVLEDERILKKRGGTGLRKRAGLVKNTKWFLILHAGARGEAEAVTELETVYIGDLSRLQLETTQKINVEEARVLIDPNAQLSLVTENF